MIGQLNLTIWAWIESIRGMKAKGIWTPFLVMGVAQTLLLLILANFYQPLVSWLVVPILRAQQSVETLHYPQFFIMLPSTFSRFNLVLDWLLGSLLAGIAYLIIWRRAANLSYGNPWGEGAAAYLKLLLARLPVILLLIAVYEILPRLIMAQGLELRGNLLRLFRYGGFLFAVLCETLFLFAPLVLLVRKRNVLGAWADTLRLFGRVPLAAYLIVMVPNLVQLPLSAMMRRSDTVVRNLAPETVGWMLLGSVIVTLLINYLVIAAGVRVFGARSPVLEGGQA